MLQVTSLAVFTAHLHNSTFALLSTYPQESPEDPDLDCGADRKKWIRANFARQQFGTFFTCRPQILRKNPCRESLGDVCMCVGGVCVCVCARITWQVARNLFIDLATPAWTRQPLHECA